MGGTIPVTAGAASMWAIGKITHNEKLARTGRQATQSVLTADAVACSLKLIGQRQNRQPLASGNAIRTFAFASVISREYRTKPLIVLGAYGFATVASAARVNGQRQSAKDVVVGALIGEFIGRYLTHLHKDKQ